MSGPGVVSYVRRRPWRNQRGQLVIPALFVIPTLVLFVWLLYDTATLSADKIQHQFALDVAAFVEMTNYSDFLNRTAYVNGAFPSRVCYEAFNDYTIEPNGNTNSAQPMNAYQFMVEEGHCPYSPKCKDPAKCGELSGQNANDWGFTYKEVACREAVGGACTVGRAIKNPSINGKRAWLFNKGHAYKWMLIGDIAVGYFGKTYNLIYSLLGMVEESQIAVFQRLTGTHYFFNRAYSMNVPGERATAANSLPQLRPQLHRQTYGTFYSVPNRKEGGYFPEPYPDMLPTPLVILTTVGGLDSQQNVAMREVRQPWRPRDKNYFKVDTKSVLGYQPYLHATVEVSGGNIWPGATPRYQTRIYP